MSPDPALRSQGIEITADYALRILLATFARDYGIVLPHTPMRNPC